MVIPARRLNTETAGRIRANAKDVQDPKKVGPGLAPWVELLDDSREAAVSPQFR